MTGYRRRHAIRDRYGKGSSLKTIIVRKEKESYSRTGYAYRAYRENMIPLYVGAETFAELIQRLDDMKAGRDPSVYPGYRIKKDF